MTESGPPERGGEFFTLVEALRVFRAGSLAGDPSDRALARAAGVSPTTIGAWLQGRRFPQDVGKVLAAVRMVQAAAVHQGVAIAGNGSAGLLDEDRWRAAYQREAQRRAGVISGGVEQAQAVRALAGRRVGVAQADLRLLGVHEAIRVPGESDEVPPEYVPRDIDAAEFGVRARVAASARRGGFVLLVGGSSVGKTRSAAEAVKAVLPEWWLVRPAGPAEVATLAEAPPARTVVWLDELERYLDGEHGLTGAVVRALLSAPRPVVIIGTLWPDRYTIYATVPAPGGADPHARERDVLGLAAVARIGPAFSAAEQGRARAAAGRDPRLRIALDAAGYGLTQTLAAAPQLVARWEDARTASPYGWAVLTAALDAARLGARAPLSADFLRAAAPGYCTSQQQAEAPGNWFEEALAYATGKLYGAVAALSPAGAGMGQVAGYTAADYLVQHASRERRYAPVPVSTWDAALSSIRDAADTARLAASARNRLLYLYAVPLYRHAAEAGDWFAAGQLADLLAERGDLDSAEQVLRARVRAGDGHGAYQLAGLLAKRGDLDGLRARAGEGDHDAAWRVADLLAERGDLDELGARADAGDQAAAWHLADLLVKRGDLDGLRARADEGDHSAAWRLADLLAERGDLDEAVQVLRARVEAGDWHAAYRVGEHQAQLGDLDGLRARAGEGDEDAAIWLADLLARRGDLDGLRDRADQGDHTAAGRMAELLAERGEVDRLRARAETGDGAAAVWLAGLLAKRGDVDGLRARAGEGDEHAARELAGLLAERGDLDEAAQNMRARAEAGDGAAAMRLAELLVKRGDVDGLRARAEAGDAAAAGRLVGLLAERGDLAGLAARADDGDSHAARELAGLLAKHGDVDTLRARAAEGDVDAARELAGLLAGRGDLDGLRARTDAGDGIAARRLIDLLSKQGRGKEAALLRQHGLNPDGSIPAK
jgi:hypothetical protein